MLIDLNDPKVKAEFDTLVAPILAAAIAENEKGLKTKNTELLGEVKALKTTNTELEAKVVAKDAEIVEVRKKSAADPAKEEEIKNLYAGDVKAAKEEAATAKKDAEDAKTQLATYKKKTALHEAMRGVSVGDAYFEAVESMHLSKCKVHELNGKEVIVVETEKGNVVIGEYLKSWSETDQGKAFVAARNNGGGGNQGGGSGGGGSENPWKAGSLNVSEQGRIIRADPDKARSLIKAAGKSPATYNL